MKLRCLSICTTRIIYCFFCALTVSSIHGQSENHLIRAGSFDHIDSYQFLSDSLVRIFGISGWGEGYRNGYGYIADFNLHKPLSEVQPQIIGEGECFFNYGITRLYKLFLKDGSSIIGFNPFDCDYWPEGGIIKLNNDGSLDWIMDFRELDIYDTIQNLVFVDSNAIGVILGSDTIAIDRMGQIVPFSLPDTCYEETIETEFGYLARYVDQLDILDAGFNVVTSYNIDEVLSINEIRTSEYLIRSADQYFILDKLVQLSTIPIPVNEFDFVWRSAHYYWSIESYGGLMVQFDTMFVPLMEQSFSPGFSAKLGVAHDSVVFSAGIYDNTHCKNIVAFTGNEEDLAFTLPQDVGVTNIEIADTILVEFLSLPFWGGGWIQHFDFINLEVTNFGLDTVREFTIQNQAVSQCGWCSHYHPFWKIDSLILIPGSSTHISLGPFEQSCIYNNLSSLCLTAIMPNGKADGNYLNDEFCEPFSILIGTESLKDDLSIIIRPNPAQDYVNIITESPHGQKIQFFDIYGRQVMNMQISSSFEEINIEYLPTGLYTILVSQDDGLHKSLKLSIIR